MTRVDVEYRNSYQLDQPIGGVRASPSSRADAGRVASSSAAAVATRVPLRWRSIVAQVPNVRTDENVTAWRWAAAREQVASVAVWARRSSGSSKRSPQRASTH